jgi:hypothetical protein
VGYTVVVVETLVAANDGCDPDVLEAMRQVLREAAEEFMRGNADSFFRTEVL